MKKKAFKKVTRSSSYKHQLHDDKQRVNHVRQKQSWQVGKYFSLASEWKDRLFLK